MSSQISKWKKLKRSGGFRRKIQNHYKNILRGNSNFAIDTEKSSNNNILLHRQELNSAVVQCDTESASTSHISQAANELQEDEIRREEWLVELDAEEEDDLNISDVEKNLKFREDTRLWAVTFNIPHLALKALFKNTNERFEHTLPQDPRTLLKTNQTVILAKVGNGTYWHHGFEFSLRQILGQLREIPRIISINVNMDGLPTFKSSKNEFWPILFNIYELPEVKPMVIGIYCGQGKPSDLTAYLLPFVEEAKILLSEGLIFNEVNILIRLR